MPNLYLTEQGSVLRKTDDRLLVEKDERILLDCIGISSFILSKFV